MTTNKVLSKIISIPSQSKKLDDKDIDKLKEFLNDFDYRRNGDYSDFFYGNLKIAVSKKGSISISIVSENPSTAMIAISKLMEKINSIIAVKIFDIKTYTHSI